jgi:acetamidase/formamidase
MAVYKMEPVRKNLHGTFSKEYEPVMSIESGDTVQFRTLDGLWAYSSAPAEPREFFEPRDSERDKGHALCGPVKINGAKPGMTLEIRINEIKPDNSGWNSAGGWPNWHYQRLGLADQPAVSLNWTLDNVAMIGKTRLGDRDYTVTLRPFMGVMGMPPNEPGIHSTIPPRFCGGNIDCKELVKGSTLYLPIAVEGGLFSIGDGHAAQGDGEVSVTAIECPMELADLTFFVREDIHLTMPRANTPAGWITFGFDEDLNEATAIALDEMLKLMGEIYSLERMEAMALASVAVDLRITQIVNGVQGVHAVLSHGAIR